MLIYIYRVLLVGFFVYICIYRPLHEVVFLTGSELGADFFISKYIIYIYIYIDMYLII
jgi:hypothetical protein